MQVEASPQVESIRLLAADGYPLMVTRYSSPQAKANLLMAGATGVPQGFYKRFAEQACARGFNVLTIDYRGVGQSKPKQLKGFEMSFVDWGSKDLAAAVDLLGEDLPLYWVGHSFGGHALGMLPNHHKISAAYCFGTGAGWAGWMPALEGLKVRLMWQLILPVIVAAKGYLAWSLLGMGEDLPKGLYRDWKRWCSFPHYFFDDPTMQALAQQYAQVTMPCVFANANDDSWATAASRNAFIKGYKNALIERLDIATAQQSVGHMGYFRAPCAEFWQQAFDWFDARYAEQAVQQLQLVDAGRTSG